MTTPAPTAEPITEEQTPVAETPPRAPEPPALKVKATPLATLTDMDLTHQDTGQPAPVSATTDNLQGTVASRNGRPLLEVSVRGYIGEEPVTVLAEDAGEFAELIGLLEKAAVVQKRTFARKRR